MLTGQLTVKNTLGLHARAAAQLVRKAVEYRSRITLARHGAGEPADAKSILSVLKLAATKGTMLDLVVDGDDEREAFAAIEQLFAGGFGEAN
jgi:phosphotransferase system HPr (HPr) family protein